MAAKRTNRVSGVKASAEGQKDARKPAADPVRDRRLIDDEVGKSIAAYELRLRGANPYRLLEFAARCAERVWRVGVALRIGTPAEASRPIRLVTGLTALATRLGEEAAHDPGRVKQAEIVKEARAADKMVSEAEMEIYTADRWSHAILELGRIAARIFELTQLLYGGKEVLPRRAASVPAHAEQAMTCWTNGRGAKAIRTSIEADLEALTGKGAPKPFPSLWRDGYEPSLENLSKEELLRYKEEEHRYKNIDVAKIRFQQLQEPPPELEILVVPKISPGTESDLENPEHPELFRVCTEAEESTRLRMKEQLDDLQGVLNLLATKSFGTPEIHKRLVDFITTLAARANAVLTISGEYPDPRDEGNIRVFTLEPITIRCDSPKTRSLAIRSVGKVQTRILTTTSFPYLYALPRERIATPDPKTSNETG
jgi:hypothetical protein